MSESSELSEPDNGPDFYPHDPRAGQRKPTGVKPVLAEIPANFADLPEEEQERFARDLARQILGTMPEGEQPYRPDDQPEESVE